MKFLQDPAEYAVKLRDFYCGNALLAREGVFDAARAHPLVGNTFWVAVIDELQKLAEAT